MSEQRADVPDLGARLTELAHTILNDAMQVDIEMERRIEAMKVVGTWWVALTKRGNKGEEKPENGESFDYFREKVRLATQGSE